MASFTVRIFSASSSGISISNASSKAITSSTVSSESAARSSTKEALGVTSPSSTPSCSTIICFTFSSTAVGICLSLCRVCKFQPKPESLLNRLSMPLNVIHRVLHSPDLFRFPIGDFQRERFFQSDHDFHEVPGVSARVILKGRMGRDFGSFKAELVHNDLPHLFLNRRHGGSTKGKLASVIAAKMLCKGPHQGLLATTRVCGVGSRGTGRALSKPEFRHIFSNSAKVYASPASVLLSMIMLKSAAAGGEIRSSLGTNSRMMSCPPGFMALCIFLSSDSLVAGSKWCRKFVTSAAS